MNKILCGKTPLHPQQEQVNQRPLIASIVKGNQASSLPTQTEINKLNAVNSERREIEQREKNVLIMGAKDTTDEMAMTTVKNIFTAIKVDSSKIASVHRFKPTNDTHPPIIKVCLNNKDDRISVLKDSKLLKLAPDYAKVYINPDLTLAQRNQKKLLIAERNMMNEKRKTFGNDEDKKYYYGICNDMIKRIP